jgi:hypothetical protein
MGQSFGGGKAKVAYKYTVLRVLKWWNAFGKRITWLIDRATISKCSEALWKAIHRLKNPTSYLKRQMVLY